MHCVKWFSKFSEATQDISFIIMTVHHDDPKSNKVVHNWMKPPKPNLSFSPFSLAF